MAHDVMAGKPKDFKIVPTSAIPLVIVVMVGLIITVSSNTLWALDFFHVVGGACWTVVDLFLGFVIGPIIGTMSIPARMEFAKKFMPKIILLMPTLVITTLVGGWQLARHEGFILSSDKHHSWVVVSMIVVGIMTFISMGFLQPANIGVLFELKKEQPNGEVISKLMKRSLYTAGLTGAMQVVTLIVMTRITTL